MAILAEPEHDDVQCAGFGDAALVLPHAGQRFLLQRTDSEELRGRNTPRLGDRATEQVGAVARLVERHAYIFVEREDVQTGQLEPTLGNSPIEFKRRVSAGHHDIPRGPLREPVGQALRRGVVGFAGVLVSADVHFVDYSSRREVSD